MADFGLSKRIEESSELQSNIRGMIPYVDPKMFELSYSSNKKSDIYSIGVLLWEISSGQPPFYSENEPYDLDLAIEIMGGWRETTVPNTPPDYVKLYTGKQNFILLQINNIIICNIYYYYYYYRVLGW